MTNPYQPPADPITPDLQPTDANYRRRIESQQSKVDRLLNRGVVFSVIWLLGGGSIYAVLLATRARRIIKASGGAVGGMRRVWWCYAMGGFGILLFSTVLISLVING
ncbi:MAG TPA: hypothetical protein VG433_16215 [Pirellulales bacterium]|jgi:hypothetical protein|nr:hypothetical protein [Pirellulales bacterium]